MQQAAAESMDLTFHSFRPVTFDLPGPIRDLERIAQNFYWTWQPDGVDLFRSIDPVLWVRCEQNPLRMLAEATPLMLWQKANDAEYVSRLNDFTAKFDAYLAEAPVASGPQTADSPAAYFCAEYGVHNSLPIYSGGLGILAGDHLKSASDMNVPLVAVGLLYRYGYFRQHVGQDGWQVENYQNIFSSGLAVELIHDASGSPLRVLVHIRGREVQAQVWLAKVGRISLYLLDSNVNENNEVDRMITGHLYGGNTETRIVQEKLLGIGGVRLLRKLGVSPSVFHLNEGHSAFLTLELAHEHIASNPNASFEEAKEVVREQCVFTTHTPVSAGNDAFGGGELLQCFSSTYLEELKLSPERFLGLGRVDPDNASEPFGMTPFALRMCRTANGVSEKHGEVSRGLWIDMFAQNIDINDVPITHVTNGVHPPTWIAPAFQSLFESKLGADWHRLIRDDNAWATAIDLIPNEEYWRVHTNLKHLLVAFIRQRTTVAETGIRDMIHQHRDARKLLSPDVLTIGFARRVAAYKRWNLLVSDVERLLRIVDNADRPVQFVFAGKAHPQDSTAKAILQELMSINHDSGWQSRAVFIEDYDQEVARYLVQGVDVWMNVPRRPLEASGTSGMKAAMNGVLNFSVLDGWWIEGYNEKNGFGIGQLEVGDDAAMDVEDAASLYETLETKIVPAFYSRGDDGLPHEWIAMMKNSIATLTPQFSSDRMLRDYLADIYKK